MSRSDYDPKSPQYNGKSILTPITNTVILRGWRLASIALWIFWGAVLILLIGQEPGLVLFLVVAFVAYHLFRNSASKRVRLESQARDAGWEARKEWLDQEVKRRSELEGQ